MLSLYRLRLQALMWKGNSVENKLFKHKTGVSVCKRSVEAQPSMRVIPPLSAPLPYIGLV
jgi:hypothetical protein